MVSLRGLSALLGVAISLVSVLGQDTTTDWPVHNNVSSLPFLGSVLTWAVPLLAIPCVKYPSHHIMVDLAD
ncbi:hypothetical protein PG994_008159 [Apiospora phragmitis]|uniref:Cytochrome b n=1 Tax=Apiospora phragmitis TaxID=2905665 RepID=A0ABR1US95_9PEZI